MHHYLQSAALAAFVYLQSAALAAFVLAVFAVLGVFAYLISGLFGPRQVDELPQQYDEPTEEEFTSLE